MPETPDGDYGTEMIIGSDKSVEIVALNISKANLAAIADAAFMTPAQLRRLAALLTEAPEVTITFTSKRHLDR